MNKANECTCPSGDGSLVHPCPAHPAVEQACWDERKLSDLGNELHNLSCSIVHENEKLAEQIGGIARELWNWPQARAALAQPSPKCATCNDSGQIVVSGPHYQGEFQPPEYETEPCDMCAQPSPAQAEQAEAERPEVVARVVHSNPVVLGQCGPLNANDELMTVAQHAASVARWAEMFNRVEQQRDAALARVAELKTMSHNYCALLMDANAKLAELEKQEPINLQHMAVAADGELRWMTGRKIDNCELYAMPDFGQAPKLYAAPVAQAQHSVPEISGIGRDAEHPRAVVLYLRNEPSEEDMRAIQNFLRAISADVLTQALHSVPEASEQEKEQGWTLDYRFVERVTDLAASRTEYTTSMEATEQVLLAARELLAAAPGNSVPQAWLDVQAERRRQITAEGWTPEHDDEHADGQMARAAACYALAGSSAPNDGTAALLVSLAWPWDEQWWKPSTARRDLVKACALALAEIERLDRAAHGKKGNDD
ncbi:TPA: hypothetical protein ACIDX0_004527 [Pseudomonas aeruginosa]